MISSKGTPSTRDILEDQHLTFNCHQFSHGVKAGRPLSRRWVVAKQCSCIAHTPSPRSSRRDAVDLSQSYSIHFYETSDEEEANHQRQMSEKYPDILPDRIGVFHSDGDPAMIYVPPRFLDVLWSAALTAGGVARSINLAVQPQKEGDLAVFEVELIEQPLKLAFTPKHLPWRRFLSGVITIAIGVLVALWIAKLLR